jgi:hypothetical protein
LNDPTSLAFYAGMLYVGNSGDDTVSEVNPAGMVTTFATGFFGPDGLAFDSAGNLYVANILNNTVSKVTPAGLVSTFASGFKQPLGLAVDAAGNLYVANSDNGTVSMVPEAGGMPSTFASGFNGSWGLAFDSAGNLYVANEGNNTVSVVNETVTVPFALGGTAVAGVDYSGVRSSPLKFEIGQTTVYITGTLLSDPGPSQTLTFTLGTPRGDSALGNISVNTLTINEPAHGSTSPPTGTTTGSSVPPVFLGEERVFSRKGKRKQLIGFEFLFNGALNAGGAQTTGNYHVTQKHGKKAKVLLVKSALDNSSNTSVTITVSGFKTGKPAQAVITGLAGANGAAIPQIITGL